MTVAEDKYHLRRMPTNSKPSHYEYKQKKATLNVVGDCGIMYMFVYCDNKSYIKKNKKKRNVSFFLLLLVLIIFKGYF